MKEVCIRCIAVVCAILTAVGSSNSQSGTSREKVLVNGGIADLGNHIISYYAQPERKQEKGVEYFVIQDLDGEDILYLPNDFERIRDISVTGTSEINIRYTDNGTDGETTIPVRFVNREGEAWVILDGWKKQKIIYGTRLSSPVRAEKIWSESVIMGEKDYRIIFERTSPPYDHVLSDMGYRQADYLLTVQDGEWNTVWEQEIINFPIEFEEVYWIKDISRDGFPDIIFCVEYSYLPELYADLRFLVWNTEMEEYELRKAPGTGTNPQWDEELSALMLYTEGFNAWVEDLEVYTYGEEDWELYAKIITDTENGKAVRENRIDSWAGSAWREKIENGIPLYPRGWEWKRKDVELCTGVTVSKYIRSALCNGNEFLSETEEK